MRTIARMLGSLLFAALACACARTSDRLAESFFLPKEGARAAQYQVETKRQVGLTTTDGVALMADVHRPIGLTKTPTILCRIPFSKTFWNRFRSDRVARYWAARGYTVVVQGSRGRYESGGDYYPLMRERADGIETLAWIAQQPWYDGRLAMWGGSAFGQTQWAVADQSQPDAYFIQIASTRFSEFFHVDGAFALESALYWALLSHGPEDREVRMSDLDRGAAGFPVIEADDRAERDVGFFNDWARNDRDSPYWRGADGVNRAHKAAAPVLLLAGWYDPFLPGMLKDYEALRASSRTAESRIIIGPYAHARTIKWPGAGLDEPYRSASIAPALAWFDYRLGVTQAPLGMAPVRIFVLGENVWRDEQEWPLKRARLTSYYLSSEGDGHSGALRAIPPQAGAERDAYVYDPQDPTPTAGGAMLGPRAGVALQNAVEARQDVLLYTTAPLSQPIEVTGPLKVVLYVSTDAPSTDFTAKLVDVHPGGAAYNIADGILRRAYRPGEPERIEIDLGATSILFGAGHSIRLEISSSNFPRFDRNPNTGESAITATRTRTARQTIWHSRDKPSHIILPIVQRQH